MKLTITLHDNGTVSGTWAYDLKPPEFDHPGQTKLGQPSEGDLEQHKALPGERHAAEPNPGAGVALALELDDEQGERGAQLAKRARTEVRQLLDDMRGLEVEDYTGRRHWFVLRGPVRDWLVMVVAALPHNLRRYGTYSIETEAFHELGVTAADMGLVPAIVFFDEEQGHRAASWDAVWNNRISEDRTAPPQWVLVPRTLGTPLAEYF